MNQPVMYQQRDPRWGKIPYAVKGENTTIGDSGCGPSSLAMVIATLANKAITPKETCAWALTHGYKALNQGTYYSYFKPQAAVYGLEVFQENNYNIRGMNAANAKVHHDKAIAALKAGHFVIACMGPGNWTTGGHFILLYGLSGNNVLINDPYSIKTAQINAPLTLMQSQVKYYFICKNPAPVREEDEVPRKIKIMLNGVVKEVDAINVDNTEFIQVRDLADTKITVGFDAVKKMPVISSK